MGYPSDKLYLTFSNNKSSPESINGFNCYYNPIIGNHLFGENILDLQINRKTVALNLGQSYDNIFSTQFSSKNRNMINKNYLFIIFTEKVS